MPHCLDFDNKRAYFRSQLRRSQRHFHEAQGASGSLGSFFLVFFHFSHFGPFRAVEGFELFVFFRVLGALLGGASS